MDRLEQMLIKRSKELWQRADAEKSPMKKAELIGQAKGIDDARVFLLMCK